MKRILAILIFISNFCNAQNYQCLQSGVKHYFINNTNYLRGIRIDSVRTTGDTTIFYPYKTFRADSTGYAPAPPASWLGGKVLQLIDGTFLFDDIWGDNTTIKPQANPGDSWLFYSDTINNTYIATVTSVDTMTILGAVDSVKNIVINSYHSGIPDTLDALNNFSVILSKNSGFVQIFDLYTFPYYSHSGAVCKDQYFSYLGIFGSVFYISDYHNPTSREIYNLNVGDMFAGTYSTYSECASYYGLNYTHYDSVIYKSVVDSFHTNYAIRHEAFGANTYYEPGGPYNYELKEDYIDTLHADTSLIFLDHMPEEDIIHDIGIVYYYYPADTTFCHLSPAYMLTSPWVFESCMIQAAFKQGFLPTYDTPVCSGWCGDIAVLLI